MTCAYAAENRHLGVLQWARAQGCPWDERTCAAAACNGYLLLLKWARAQGCPWHEETWHEKNLAKLLGLLEDLQ